jgi:hypothetical protein
MPLDFYARDNKIRNDEIACCKGRAGSQAQAGGGLEIEPRTDAREDSA